MSPFVLANVGGELRQSEIITEFVQFSYDPTTNEGVETRHEYVIVLSQDCDLLRDYEDRSNGQACPLNGVLLFELQPADVANQKLDGRDIRKQVKRNQNDRYHYFEALDPSADCEGKGLPELIIDFRRFFTMHVDEIYRQCDPEQGLAARRRCMLANPFKEHLQSRMGFYLQRVALP